MSKVPPWIWLFAAAFAAVGIVFFAVSFLVDAFFTPTSELPLIYWVMLGILATVFALFLITLFRWHSSMTQVYVPGLWAGVLGSAFGSVCCFSVVLFGILTGSKLGGFTVFVAAMGMFNLSIACVLSARLDRARRNE